MDVLLDSGLLMDPAVLAVLTESGPGGKKRRKVVIPQPRRGELEGHGWSSALEDSNSTWRLGGVGV